MTDITMWQDQSVHDAFMDRGAQLFAQLKSRLRDTTGIVAIELDSGDIFVGETLGQANEAARHKYLDQWLYFVRADNPEAAIALPVW